jgi:plastocyanin
MPSRSVRAIRALAMMSLFLASTIHAETRVIEFKGGTFMPSELTIEAGDTLRVVNLDGVPHTFTANDGSYDSGRLMHGDATQIVLARTGPHDFRCSLGGQTVHVMVMASRGAVHRG